MQGGQILRMATAFSVLLQKPVTVRNIRAGRDKPGLRPQHLNGILLLRDICNGKLIGDEIGSTEINLKPGPLTFGNYIADTGTAGSVGLLLQVSLPCLLLAGERSHMTLKGGTDTDMAPPFNFTTDILQPVLEKFGAKCHFEVVKRGYFPRGGGVVKVSVEPVRSLKPIEMLERGTLVQITGYSYVAGKLPVAISHQMADGAIVILKHNYADVPINIARIKEPPAHAVGDGFGIVLIAETSSGCRLAGSALGNVRKHDSAGTVGEKAANMLVSNLKEGGCVDEHLQDQMIIFMAMAEGRSKIKCGSVTLHTETAIHVAHLMTKAKFTITKDSSGNNIIDCDGHGVKHVGA